MPAPRRSRLPRAWPLALAATVLALGTTMAVRGLAPASAPPTDHVADAEAPRPTRGIAVTELPLAESPNPEALRSYREALVAMRAGQDFRGKRLQATIALDPLFAAAHLQAAAWSMGDDARDDYQRAAQLKDKLGPRDAALLAALEPCCLPEVPDAMACKQRVGDLSARFPDDAQLAHLAGNAASQAGDPKSALAHFERATALDPLFVDASAQRALTMAYLGDLDGAARALAECTREHPYAGSCLDYGMWVSDQLGDRETFARYARAAWVDENQPDLLGFADALLVAGEPRGAVLDALKKRWKAVGADSHGAYRIEWDRAALDVIDGDFASAVSRLKKVEDDAVGTGSVTRRWNLPALLIGTMRETGDAEGAGKLARKLRERLAGLPVNSWSDDIGIAVEPLPKLLDAELRGGLLTAKERDVLRAGWLKSWESRAQPFYRPYLWLDGYAAFVENEADAREASAALPAWGGVPAFRPLAASNHSLGRFYLYAGQRELAIQHLKLAARSSLALEFPLETVRSNLLLGIALADAGDRKGACAAYAEVQRRWGHAKPRSLTAAEANKRATALACPQR